jgi:TRAP-type uncharacterized transport system substrate-binding protein
MTPSALAYCGQKMVLTMGSTLVDRPIPTVMRPNHLIYVRDDAPDSFAYAVAKALDEHRHLFQVQLEPWYYDPQTVAVSKVIPMHPGAMKYYRERGFVK